MGSIQPASGLGEDTILVLVPRDPMREVINGLETKFPGVKVRWLNTKVPAGLMRTEDMPLEIWDGVTIVCAYQIPEASLLPKLRFVQLTSAGADQCAQNPLYKDEKITFCTSNGAHPPQIAEWVIGTWLSHQHQFGKYGDYMKKSYWEPAYQASFEDSSGLRMGILGYGAIGRQCANLAKSLGMDVIAFTMRERRTPESRKDDSYCVPGTGDPDGLIPSRWFHGTTKEDLNNFLSQDLDLLVICLPLTSSTRNMISKEQFGILSKKKAFLSNVGRGGHVHTADLITALEQGQIRGAAIDVTDPEPLPNDHPLWKAPNLFITPHVSWVSGNYWSRILNILEHNLLALSDGTPFVNKVNKELNY
ncbi:uncharacterized protein Z518_08650 [Rhinocladiella mackenziei CBS 650.93]|uniref:D-isomer specific 2-hydroxyacid dehydrogenase NAD-binding domain-containing protein n=1 Tax=Rhinocladiella mackenziei CBS 650.93 TaxID=1442369 RepID=A0A0D2GWV9_9EURO|nr:uncharacterized protein Z518_08650 [Rhinocladiella mackenziei CBS 650.93]KIX02708.1 hypothetical protein Z518_08650 [Rhinocladiella mackenziei CBS 650.93]